MSCVLPLGAFKKGTTEYVYPAIANKSDKHVCPECAKDLILRAGSVRIKHFAHFKSDNPCSYYDKPSEAQIHKDAKMLMKMVLDNGRALTVQRVCIGEYGGNGHCRAPEKGFEEFEIPVVSDSSTVVIEHRFVYNGGTKIADVAYLDNDELVCIFEICNTHKTADENRPEPWFEIDAANFINTVNKANEALVIKCIRKYKCIDCVLGNCIRCDKELPAHILDLSESKQMCQRCNDTSRRRIYLDVPYHDKQEIKDWGGLWDPTYRKWYIKTDCDEADAENIMAQWNELDLYVLTPYLLKRAKQMLAKLLREEPEIGKTGIIWACDNESCEGYGDDNVSYEYVLNNEEEDSVCIDYKIPRTNLVADVAIVNEGNVKYVFKIENKNKTKLEKFPEPWFEICIDSIFDRMGDVYTMQISNHGSGEDTWWGLRCGRHDTKRRRCKFCKLCSEKWVENIPTLAVKLGRDNGWFQIKPCVYCKRDSYNPIFIKKYKQLCKLCFSNHTAELQKMYKIEGCIISD
jgi:hypothetical protein